MNLSGRRYGHIRVERILGQGGMGDVYQGFDEKLARRVALKVLHPDARLDGEARTRLMREARSLSQLDHPNICRIYDFIEEGDSDVLVLEMIEGRTLEQALHEGLSLAEKLRIARDVASVLVAAHREGILHRDLKPENVMLTNAGQVKVLDFGLARFLEQKSKSGRNLALVPDPAPEARLRVRPEDEKWFVGEPEKTAVRPAPREPRAVVSATAFGVTVGTPLFMSPEQARGEELTTASDIYSFGLMLQVMFTGRDPYPTGLGSHDIMLFAARGESLPVSGVRRDIAALTKSLKALAPSDRPTAADALRRLEHIIAAPKRLIRDIVAAVAVALIVFGVWKYTTDLRRAEAEARMRRSQADALIAFMLGDLRKKLEPVGKLDILDDVGAKAIEYMSSLDPKTLTAEDLARTSKALYQLGEVRSKQGNLDAAVAAYQKALALAKEAHRRAPNDLETALAVGVTHFYVGSALLQKNDAAGALAEMQEYRRIGDQLAAKNPEKYAIERAYGHSAVARALEVGGNLEGSVAEFRITEQIKQARAAAKPNDADRAADLALTLNNIASVLEDLGRLAEAKQYYQREFAISDSLVRLDPKHANWKDRLANSHSYMAELLENLGDTDGALAHHRASLTIYADLAEHDPANTQWRRNVAITLCHLGDALRVRGRAADALAEIEAAESAIAAVRKKDPQRAWWRYDEASIEMIHARILHAAGQDDLAHAKAEAAVAALAELERGQAKVNLANAYLVLGDAAVRQNRAAAEESWRSAAALVEPFVARGNPKVGAIYAQAMIRLGRLADARPVIEAIHRNGYRQADFEKICRSVVESGS